MSRPLRVLQVHPPVGHGVDVYRVDNLREQVEHAGHQSEVLTLAELRERGAPAALAVDRDLVILHRVAWDARVEALVAAAREHGARTVFEADDLVFVPGAEHWVDGVRRLPASEVGLYAEGVERYAASYRHCDAFLASTPFLAGLRPFGPKPCQVVRNVLGRRQLEVARRIRRARRTREGEGRVVGFGAGTATHDRDLLEVVPALRELLARHADLRVQIVGPVELGAAFAGFEDRVIRSEARPWEQWWEVLAGFDVALAPLHPENPYCRAKSALKFLEAAALEVPLVASRTDDYEHEIDDGRTGFLAKDANDWLRVVEALLEDPEGRRKMGLRAREHVESRCTTEAVAGDTLEALQALRAGRPRVPAAGERSMEIGWLIPSPFPGSGGHANIFGAARCLERRGHRNTFLVDTSQLQVHDADGIRDFVGRNFGETGAAFRPGWDLSALDVDLAVATSWATAESVAHSDASAKLYFVQDFENLFFPPGEDAVRAERTYHLGLSCVTLGSWLTHELRARYAADSTPFSFPVTVEDEPGISAQRGDPPLLLFFAQPSKPRRGYRLGLEALERFHEACPQVKIAFFGAKDVDRASVPVPFEDHGILSEQQLAELYRRADAALVISMTNPTLVSPNMMRCGCVPVDLDLPNNRFEYRDDEDSLLAEPTPDGIATALRRLFREPELLARLREAGAERVAARSLESSADEIEAAFTRKWLTGEVAERAAWLDSYQGDPAAWSSLADGPMSQPLRPRSDRLSRICLRLGTFDRVPGALRCELLDARSGATLVDRRLPGERIRNNEWNALDFEPIADSGGRELLLRLSMVDASAAPVAVYLSGEGAHRDGPASRGGAALAAPLCFRTWLRPAGAAAPASHAAPPVERESGGRATASPVSPEAARIVELIRARAEGERARAEALERRAEALERATAGVGGWVDRLEARFTRPPFDRLWRLLGLAAPRETFLEKERFVTAELRGPVRIAQRFAAERDGLDGVMVRLGTEGRRLVAPLVMSLRAGGPDGPVLRELSLAPSDVCDNHYAIFAFEPIPDSADRGYCFELSSPGSVRGCAARAWGHRDRGASGQRRYHCGARAKGRLDFQLRYAEAPQDA